MKLKSIILAAAAAILMAAPIKADEAVTHEPVACFSYDQIVSETALKLIARAVQRDMSVLVIMAYPGGWIAFLGPSDCMVAFAGGDHLGLSMKNVGPLLGAAI